MLHNRHETPRRADRPGVGATGAAPAAREAADGTDEQGPSTDHQRHPLAGTDWEPLARSARAIRPVVDGIQPVLALAGGRDLGPDPGGSPARGRCGRGGGLECPLRGRDGDPCAPARRWYKGWAPETEALGKSQGGFSTKVHLKAEGHGQPITVPLTPGQQHEATVFEPLMQRGAIRRPGRGRPRVRPCRASGDKGYAGRRHRAGLRRRASATPFRSGAPSTAPAPSIAPPTAVAPCSRTSSLAARGTALLPPATTSAPSPFAPPGPLS